MKSLFLRLIWIALIPCFSSSFATVFDYPLNKSSKSDLVRCLNKINSHDVITGKFKQIKFVKRLKHNFVSTGEFRVSRISGIVWKIQKPYASELMISGNNISERTSDGQIRMLHTKENDFFVEFTKTIQAVKSANLVELESKFSIFCEKKSNAFKIGLIPRDATVRKFIANIEMNISTNLDRLIVTDENGSVTYEFTNHKFVDETVLAPSSYVP